MGRCTCISQKQTTLDTGGPAKIWEVGALGACVRWPGSEQDLRQGLTPTCSIQNLSRLHGQADTMTCSILGTWAIIEGVGDYG